MSFQFFLLGYVLPNRIADPIIYIFQDFCQISGQSTNTHHSMRDIFVNSDKFILEIFNSVITKM
jgi:hypothetical protein